MERKIIYRDDDLPEKFTGIAHFPFLMANKYYINGRAHRLDGPAVTSEGSLRLEFWFLSGKCFLDESSHRISARLFYRLSRKPK